MSLYSVYFQPQAPSEPVDVEIGLADVRKGLLRIIQGYLLCVVAALGAAGLLGYVIWLVHDSRLSNKAAEKASTVLFGGALVLALLGLFSFSLIVRGKWLCLMSAPERFHAKWFMFASIMCILVGPTLGFGSFLVGERKQSVQRAGKDASTILLRQMDEYKRSMKTLDTSHYVELAGDFAALLSSVFFVLFLRAVALCCDDAVRARFAVFYLLFTVLLVAAVVVFVLKPSLFLSHPQLLLGVAGGGLLGALWYFYLILSALSGINGHLSRRRSAFSAP